MVTLIGKFGELQCASCKGNFKKRRFSLIDYRMNQSIDETILSWWLVKCDGSKCRVFSTSLLCIFDHVCFKTWR